MTPLLYLQSCAFISVQGPVENLTDHLADPSNVNAFNYATKFTPSP